MDDSSKKTQVAARLFNYGEASKYLGVCERTLAAIKASGSLPHIKIGTRVLFDIEDLDSFIAAQKKGVA